MQKTLALVLKKQNIGETDRILTVFSPVFGKKRVVARGIRKPLSKMAGHLDTLMVSQLILTDEENLPKITSAELIESFEMVRNSLPLLERAFAISRLIERVALEEVTQQSLFQLSVDALSRLNDEQGWTQIWLSFLSGLTQMLGLSVDRFTCEKCGEKINDGAYWDIDGHYWRCPSCVANRIDAVYLGGPAVKLLYLLSTQKYAAMKKVRIPEEPACQVEEILLRQITEWLNKPWSTYRAIN